MKDERKNIRQKLTDNYPEPDVPVESAWTGMKGLLDVKIPVTQSLISKLTFFKVALIAAPAGLLSLGAALWILVQPNQTNFSFLKNPISTVNTNISSKLKTQTDQRSEMQKDTAFQEKSGPDNIVGTKVPNSRQAKSTGLLPADLSDKKATARHSRESGNGKNDLHPETVFEQSETLNSINSEKKKDTGFRSTTDVTLQSSIIKESANPASLSVGNILIRERSNRNDEKKSRTENRYALLKPTGKTKNKEDKNDSESRIIGTAQLAGKSELFLSFKLLHSKRAAQENLLKRQFDVIRIQPLSAGFTESLHRGKRNYIFQNIHFGLQWNAILPATGFNMYFKGTNEKNQPYHLLIPGLWVKKQLSEKNELQLRVSPSSQYFGSKTAIASSTAKFADSTNYQTTLRLLKISGFNVGLQFNRKVSRNWHAGLGANLQWQQRGLISRNILTSDTLKVIDYDELFSVKQTSNEGKYLNLYFVTANAEIFYAWRQFQLGGGIIVPVTSMTTSTAKENQKPLSAQLFIRWQLK